MRFRKVSPAFVSLLISLRVNAMTTTSNIEGLDYYPPYEGGGYQLIDAKNGYGEPLNVIVSGRSSPKVLTNKGFLNWARSLGFTYECLGLHGGGYMAADLGDGHGWVNQTGEYRRMYSSSHLGTCLETFVGGGHFRFYRQNGSNANTGAMFLAVSLEEDLDDQHTVSPDGYDLGRDELVARAVNGSEYDGVQYKATSQGITGLLSKGKKNINHGIAIDGVVKLLTVEIVAESNGDDDSDSDDGNEDKDD